MAAAGLIRKIFDQQQGGNIPSYPSYPSSSPSSFSSLNNGVGGGDEGDIEKKGVIFDLGVQNTSLLDDGDGDEGDIEKKGLCFDQNSEFQDMVLVDEPQP